MVLFRYRCYMQALVFNPFFLIMLQNYQLHTIDALIKNAEFKTR